MALLLLASFAAVIVAATIYHLSQQYRSTVDGNLRAARNTMRTVSAHAAHAVGESYRVLDGIADLYRHEREEGDIDERFLHDVMAEKLKHVPSVLTFLILDEKCQGIANARRLPGGQHVAELDGMRSDPAATVGDGEFMSAVFKNPGEGDAWFLPIGMEVHDKNGVVVGYVMAVLKTSYFADYYETLDVGDHGRVAMWTADGHLVAATATENAHTGDYREAEVSIRNTSEQPAVSDRELVYVNRSGPAVEAIANNAVGLLPLSVSVVLDGRDFLASWYDARDLIVLTVMGVILVMSGFAVVLLRQVRRTELNEIALRQAKAIAEEANDTKSRFLAHMSHEFRTPLNAIMGFSEIIRNKVLGGNVGPEYVSYADHIHRSGEHLLNIVNDILDVAKIESGVQPLQQKAIDMRAVIAAATSFVEGLAKQRALHIRVALAASLPLVTGDERFSRQVLINLLSNAIKFSPQGGEIVVSAVYARGRSLDISVTDHGPGIEPSILKRLGEPFLQADPAVFHSGQGTGLGLSICKRYMDLLGGDLVIESVVNSGTTATVRFPPHLIIDGPIQETAA